MTTRPCVVSMINVFSGSLISAIPASLWFGVSGLCLIRAVLAQPRGATTGQVLRSQNARGVLSDCSALGVGQQVHAHDLIRVAHAARPRIAPLDLVDVLHALDHAAPDGVLAVEVRRRIEDDEELAV